MRPISLIVAEDDPAMRWWLRTVLTRMGAVVRLASSGWECLSLLAGDDGVDLVISDVRTPMPGGIDVLAMARIAGVSVPFVLITASPDERVREAARRLDAVILDKPVLAEELVAVVAQHAP